MKAVLDISPIRQPLTGIGRYTYELAQHLLKSKEIDTLRFFKNLKILEQTSLPELEEPSNPKQKKSGFISRSQKRILEQMKNSPFLFSNLIKSRSYIQKYSLRNYKDHIFHSPNFYVPELDSKIVVTVHDLSFIFFPETHPTSRVIAMKQVMEDIRKRADHIISVSDFAKNEIIQYLNWPEEKITTTHLAASDIFHPRDEETLYPYLKDLGLTPKNYSLFVGTLEPRKNIEILITAYENLSSSLRLQYPLVICGARGWEDEKLLLRINKAQRENWLYKLDYLPHKALPLVIAGARLFLFPSIYEGFGIPPLEAMQSGVPTLVSNAASLPEVVRGASPCLDPHNETEWQSWIEKALIDESWREKATRQGLNRAAEFSWARCAAETADIYRKL